MKNFGHWLAAALIVFIAALALLEVDRRGSNMYGNQGRITEVAVNVATDAAGYFED